MRITFAFVKRDHSSSINREEILRSFLPLLSACNVSTDLDKIVSLSRKRDCVDARAVIAICLRDYGFSFSQIGYVLNRDHATVMYLQNRINYFGEDRMNFRVMRAFRNPVLREAVGAAVINFHYERVRYHQNVINKLKAL